MLRVEATSFDGLTNYIVVDGFWIEDESNDYRLHLGELLEGAQEHFQSLLFQNGMRFTTHDQDNDFSSINCAIKYKGGNWHKSCRKISPNGPYYQHSNCVYNKGIHWDKWLTQSICLKTISLAIKRKI